MVPLPYKPAKQPIKTRVLFWIMVMAVLKRYARVMVNTKRARQNLMFETSPYAIRPSDHRNNLSSNCVIEINFFSIAS